MSLGDSRKMPRLSPTASSSSNDERDPSLQQPTPDSITPRDLYCHRRHGRVSLPRPQVASQSHTHDHTHDLSILIPMMLTHNDHSWGWTYRENRVPHYQRLFQKHDGLRQWNKVRQLRSTSTLHNTPSTNQLIIHGDAVKETS